ncbi:LpxL/LpxP family acyltransferase [Parapedobacter tibetensis]|uniref:LpxL/LpxP family acyltransferase n=1 Tax=Parapedobacter tibetensis TaxID=2972951 RepID=UPI00214DD480|nr:hypothetical protein [Parapedobacter tibetensis]
MENRYKKEHAEIYREVERLDIGASPTIHNQYTFFSANIEHFLPMVPAAQHEELFRETLVYQRLSGLDLSYGVAGYLPPISGWDPEWANSLRHRVGIIACAHMGAHMLIGLLLAKAQVPLALLVVSHLVEPLKKFWKAAAEKDPSIVLPQIVDASSSSALRQLVRFVQAGVSLLIYWDGEEHSGGDDGLHQVCVPLLGQHIRLQRGIAFLSKVTQAPIVPVVAFRQRDGSVGVHQGTERCPQHYRGKDFTRLALQSVVQFFSPYFIHFPAQWDKWTHLHRMALPERFFVEAGRNLSDRYGILKGGDTYFLFERRDYHTLALPENYMDILGHCAKNR